LAAFKRNVASAADACGRGSVGESRTAGERRRPYARGEFRRANVRGNGRLAQIPDARREDRVTLTPEPDS
jgi:hypothetical protein